MNWSIQLEKVKIFVQPFLTRMTHCIQLVISEPAFSKSGILTKMVGEGHEEKGRGARNVTVHFDIK